MVLHEPLHEEVPYGRLPKLVPQEGLDGAAPRRGELVQHQQEQHVEGRGLLGVLDRLEGKGRGVSDEMKTLVCFSTLSPTPHSYFLFL